jgi:DNA-binding CsgD family transcriptional regulator
MGASCTAGCCPHDSESGPAPGCPEDIPAAPLAERAAHLYVCQGLSTYRIAALTGISRQRITRLLSRSGVVVKPRGAGRPKSRDRAARDADELMEYLYVERRLSSTQVAALTGLADRTVRQRLRAGGVPMRTRGRCNREDRTAVAPEILAELYVRSGLAADEIGAMLGVSRRVVLRAAHDVGLPVRIGGPPPRGGPEQIELLRALYADPAVRRALDRHGVRAVLAPGPVWERFPVPVPLSAELAAELYDGCGIALHHIELLTGQPAATVRRLLHGNGITIRPPGGRTPFIKRWRAGD